MSAPMNPIPSPASRKAPPIPPLSSGVCYSYGNNGERICTGSAMGRANRVPSDGDERNAPCKLRLVRLAWVDGDYDQGGAYWGRSATAGDIYRAIGDCGDTQAEVFVRAHNRREAKAKVREVLSGATFYR